MKLTSFFIFFCVLLLSSPLQGKSKAKPKYLPQEIQHSEGLHFKLCSHQKITKALFFDIVEVGIYFPECPEKLAVFNDDMKLLRFHYLRKVKGKQFKEGAEEYLSYNLSKADYDKCFAEYESLNDSYLDVKKGDFYDMFQLDEVGLDLYLNNKPLANFKNKACEFLYFNIWFGEKSMSSGFKKLLK